MRRLSILLLLLVGSVLVLPDFYQHLAQMTGETPWVPAILGASAILVALILLFSQVRRAARAPMTDAVFTLPSVKPLSKTNGAA